MKGFKDSTKTIAGHNFAKVTSHVRPHTRKMPTQKVSKPVASPFAEGGRVAYTGPDRNKPSGKPTPKSSEIKGFLDKSANFDKTMDEAETNERTGRVLDAMRSDLQTNGKKSPYAWAVDNPKKPPSSKPLYSKADRLDDSADLGSDFKKTPLKDRTDLQWDGSKFPNRGMKAVPKARGGPVAKRDPRTPLIPPKSGC